MLKVSTVIDTFNLFLSTVIDTMTEILIEFEEYVLLTSQVKYLDNYLIAADDIETGGTNKVPIWLFGFLY